ncbi:MAG: TetR-like C-terminal domain-containing protein [Hyphomicrobium sp.]|uniref:TetR-like C-terminal domain-containing protein n=1 Tax=Hyphomicrobium sp. TaxID=82 RepID=UPI0039E5DCCB
MLAATNPLGMPPKDEILAVAKAYMCFALTNTALYRLMFSSEIRQGSSEALEEASSSTFTVLLDILTRGQQSGVFKAGALQGQAAACWALVHGLTMLELDRLLMPEKVGEQPVAAALAVLLEGLVA